MMVIPNHSSDGGNTGDGVKIAGGVIGSGGEIEEFTNEPVVIKAIVDNSEAKASEAKPKAARKNNCALIIEDWVSDSEEENVVDCNYQRVIIPVLDNAKGVNHQIFPKRITPALKRKLGSKSDYEEIDGGYIAFGGNPKGGKITGKGTIKTDDYSRFNGFSSSTKDETSGILKSFITRIENIVDHKVKGDRVIMG
ncbi:hypothetical protein Tco_0876759 [Tanacetum coccineum]|uniref:BRCT domain-containing protein n=1 Tax=Tanacetum coccineum TaxID=301880 RepID=A0ABQ5BUR1_9ASTR